MRSSSAVIDDIDAHIPKRRRSTRSLTTMLRTSGGLEMSNHGFDRRAPSQLALDRTEDAAFLIGDEDVVRMTVWGPQCPIDIGVLDRAAGEVLMMATSACPITGVVQN